MGLTKAELIEAIQINEELLRRKASRNFASFVQYNKPDYEMQWFHRVICRALQDFDDGKIKKLMVLMPPQHGKSELTTRQFPPYLLGRNPNRKVFVVTYNDILSNTFNRSIQRNMDNEQYLRAFPNTKIPMSSLHRVHEPDKQRNTQQIDILGYEGHIKTIGRGGTITGQPMDIGIIDDILKGREEANSETIRSKVYDFYTNDFKTRLHNNSQQLAIQTKWHELDLAGRILAEEDDWVVIKLPAIKTADESLTADPRQVGEALWPGKHSLERILEIQRSNPVTFNSLYQQEPKPPTDILVYKDWIELMEWPALLLAGHQVSWGLDFGKTSGTNALVKGVVTSDVAIRQVKVGSIWIEQARRKAYLQECLYAKGVPTTEIAKAAFDNGYKSGEIMWCDHIPTKIIELRNLGIAAMAAVKGPGSVSSGIDKMNEFQVYYVGKNMKMESNKYQYVTYDNIITNEPVDEWNHLMDADRYCLLSRFFRE